MKMKGFIAIILVITLSLIACENDSHQQLEAQKIAQKNEAVFKNISKMWQFNFPNPRPEVAGTLNQWNEWRQFEIELSQKPKSTLSAFKMKTKNVSSKADTLVITAPFGKYSTVSLLIIFSVSLVAGQQIDNTSETEKRLLMLS